MRTLSALTILSLLAACGSPEKYAKDHAADSADAVFGFRLGEHHAEWGRGISETMRRANDTFGAGDTARALVIADSLIRTGESHLDTIPFNDPRAKYLILVLTDIQTQAITWEQAAGHTECVERRTAQLQAFADRIKREKAAAAPTP